MDKHDADSVGYFVVSYSKDYIYNAKDKILSGLTMLIEIDIL